MVKTLTESENLKNISRICTDENAENMSKTFKLHQYTRRLTGRDDAVLNRVLRDDIHRVGSLVQSLQG